MNTYAIMIEGSSTTRYIKEKSPTKAIKLLGYVQATRIKKDFYKANIAVIDEKRNYLFYKATY